MRPRGRTAALVLQPRRAVHERAAGFDLGGDVRQLELHRLELRDRLPELSALARVGIGEVVRALRDPDAHRRDRDSAAVQDLEELVEPVPARTEQVRLRDGAIPE